MKVGIIMKNDKIEKIMKLDKEIDNIAMKTTSCFGFREKQNLNNYDKKVIEYY